MLFSSMSFIFIFLPLVCLIYFVVRPNLRNYVLLAASILFYAWGEPEYLAIMLLTILVNYGGAILMNKHPKYKKGFLAATIITNLGFLTYFKYFNFFIGNLNELFHGNLDFIEVLMPIGISFYTFQAISYVVDVYRGEVSVQRDIFKLSLFICLFPQLIAGPIVKYNDIADQIDHREVDFDKLALGVKRFIIGLAKKVLIANTLGAVADKIFVQAPDTLQTSVAWIGSLAYSFQLFFDFSGYSDMAIGLGLIFGFHIKENFNYPYISKSITEFWRRWHISLSTWFKQYLYIPLGGNRVSKSRNYLNLSIVFLLTGFWHGASWSFVIWGIWHGVFIIFEKISGWHKESSAKLVNATKHLYTVFVFVIGWVIFRADNIAYAWTYIKNMFGFVRSHDVLYEMSYYVDNIEIIAFVAAFLCSVPLFSNILHIKQERRLLNWLVNAWLLVLFLLSVASMAASTYNPFIYFRF
ncbi:MAG: MBOAT family protein [Bacteroidales bacterium]|nr:MBOAT family protein [Bacteroidales bacterium]MDD4641196.1 MBOAT family protein [Bacteroidales bacterium]